MTRPLISSVLPILLALTGPLGAQQTQADDHTRYELQAPGSSEFRIIYDVTATTAGAEFYYNSIRAGAEETVHGVTDLATGAPLDWRVVDGAEARTAGHARASLEGRYIQIRLATPIPDGGETRLRIDKTYGDRDSYYVDGDDVVFARSLGIRRNAVVLPAGYELVEVNYPSQVAQEADGRLRVSFMNRGMGAVPLRVRGRKLGGGADTGPPAPTPEAQPPAGPGAMEAGTGSARVGYTFSERAAQDREIVYYLQQPETSSFRLYHDYTESRPGVDRYLNVVRPGSRASDPSATNLETGAALEVETLVGSAITDRGIDLGQPTTPETEVVVIWFDPIQAGRSTRLRIWETYTDPGRYLLHGNELVWDRGFGRPRNRVVLPEGWYLTANAAPASISLDGEGRVQLDYVNDRPGNVQVFIKARRR